MTTDTRPGRATAVLEAPEGIWEPRCMTTAEPLEAASKPTSLTFKRGAACEGLNRAIKRSFRSGRPRARCCALSEGRPHLP